LTVRAVLIDDSVEDLKYADRLTKNGFSCEGLSPPATAEELRQAIAERVRDGLCDVVLLDYRLDAEPVEAGSARRRYRGGTVAAQLKEYVPKVPIVVVTTEQKLRDSLRDNPQIRRLFDYQILKSRLAARSERNAVVEELTALAEGFAKISTNRALGWRKIAQLLDADRDDETEFEALELAAPPKATAEIAQWILHELLAYPGPLLGEAEASALLGVTRGTFVRDDLQSVMASSRYTGVFSGWHARWWRGRLQRWLTEAGGKDPGISGAGRARAIAGAVNRTTRSIRAAKCVWCSGDDVAYACALRGEPVDAQHSLAAVVDERPRWSQTAMVCFECVATGRAQDVKFQPGTDDIVRSIERGEISRGASNAG
jgi:CheY-like chemotaxis protein